MDPTPTNNPPSQILQQGPLLEVSSNDVGSKEGGIWDKLSAGWQICLGCLVLPFLAIKLYDALTQNSSSAKPVPPKDLALTSRESNTMESSRTIPILLTQKAFDVHELQKDYSDTASGITKQLINRSGGLISQERKEELTKSLEDAANGNPELLEALSNSLLNSKEKTYSRLKLELREVAWLRDNDVFLSDFEERWINSEEPSEERKMVLDILEDSLTERKEIFALFLESNLKSVLNALDLYRDDKLVERLINAHLFADTKTIASLSDRIHEIIKQEHVLDGVDRATEEHRTFLEKFDLERKPIRDDGNCFYRVLDTYGVEQGGLNDSHHSRLYREDTPEGQFESRKFVFKAVSDFLKEFYYNNVDDSVNELTLDDDTISNRLNAKLGLDILGGMSAFGVDDIKELASYREKIKISPNDYENLTEGQDQYWGGSVMLPAIARAMKAPIILVSAGGTTKYESDGRQSSDITKIPDNALIFLHNGGSHWETARPKS